MKKLIPFKLAGNLLLISLGLLIIVHMLVLIGLVPYENVWGGQITDSASLLTYESVAIGITLLFGIIISAKLGYLGDRGYGRALTIGVWFVFVYFILNSLGNLASGVSAENFIFAPISLLMALLTLRLAVEG